jgi:hypothetical protein
MDVSTHTQLLEEEGALLLQAGVEGDRGMLELWREKAKISWR